MSLSTVSTCPRRSAWKIGVIGLAATLVLSGCAAAQPKAELSQAQMRQVRILVDPESTESMVLGEIYRLTLAEENRAAVLIRNEDLWGKTDVNILDSGEIDFAVVCTGNMYYALDPKGATDLARQRAAGTEADKDYLAAAHMGMMGALPGTLTTVDPSSAPGCVGEEKVDLPMNYVPVYTKDTLDRDERYAVGAVTKFLTEEELDDLVRATEKNGDVYEVVSTWIETSSSPQDTGNGDSDSAASKDKNKDKDKGKATVNQ